ncbi:MAG: hypothetical protein HYV19_08025 [Gemmatimonadetes bacterium]|nr:hypothetical protein [Gemmatimonadota bacterium]
MGRTKAEIEAENRDLRDLVGGLYDLTAQYLEPEESDDDDEDVFIEEDE